MKAIYPNDDAFRTAFSEKIIRTSNSRNSRIVRYIFCALEKQASGNEYEFESDNFNIEHILPQNPEKDWDAFTDEEVDSMAYRLGNMTLLSKKVNKKLSNAGFALKKEVFSESQFELARKIAEENDEWTPARIAVRRKSLAKLATTVWRVAQLS
jgi:hypothetical protein